MMKAIGIRRLFSAGRANRIGSFGEFMVSMSSRAAELQVGAD
jgi:hypothetical protein